MRGTGAYFSNTGSSIFSGAGAYFSNTGSSIFSGAGQLGEVNMYRNAGSGPLRAYRQGSLGATMPGPLRSFKDGSLGVPRPGEMPGPLQAFREGSLGKSDCGCSGTGEYFSTNGMGEYFSTNGMGEYFSTNGLGELTEEQKKYVMYGGAALGVIALGAVLLKMSKKRR